MAPLKDRPSPARAAREAERRDAFMRIAAGEFRRRGLADATMEQVAAAAGVTKVVLYRRFPSKEALVRAIFDDVMRRLDLGVARPWPGYGAGFRRVLAAARAFEDGYILLVRDARLHAAYRPYAERLRAGTAERLTALLWRPAPPPPPDERPALLGVALEPMVAFANSALADWVERGDPGRDDHYVRWVGQMIQAWRKTAAELLDLDSPETDWPFEVGPGPADPREETTG